MKLVKIKDNITLGSISTSLVNIEAGQTIRLPNEIARQLDPNVFDVQEEYKKEQSEKVFESGETKKYTKEQLVALNKGEQVDLLKDLGLTATQIRKLSNESSRVNKILELQ